MEGKEKMAVSDPMGHHPAKDLRTRTDCRQRRTGKKKMAKTTQRGSCETCTYYTYDEEYESYMCDVNMDEDEYMRLISDQHYQCPYYRNGDDYRIVRHQM